MSHSVPSESSATDTTFIVGADLVQFDRHELPIYQTPESKWAEACFDEAPYGAPLDRVFGEPGDLHIDSVPREEQQAALTALPGDDPLVVLAALSDGLILPASEPAAETAAAFDFGANSHPIVHLHDGWSWDIAGADWTFDFHA
ncbi:MAG TPA: hypothetical protein VI232_12365 [Reyranella sp.]|jgi:hypothetical protein|nr:hypothetical protein [Rhodospirillaceae bacterium]MEA2845406.1 hypothetical protein [Rhodospirillaceae bacterium]